MVCCTNDDDVGVLVGHLAEHDEELVQLIVTILLDHLQVGQRSLEQQLSCHKVENQEHRKNLHEHDEILVALLYS